VRRLIAAAKESEDNFELVLHTKTGTEVMVKQPFVTRVSLIPQEFLGITILFHDGKQN
jgi:hypothetical protein